MCIYYIYSIAWNLRPFRVAAFLVRFTRFTRLVRHFWVNGFFGLRPFWFSAFHNNYMYKSIISPHLFPSTLRVVLIKSYPFCKGTFCNNFVIIIGNIKSVIREIRWHFNIRSSLAVVYHNRIIVTAWYQGFAIWRKVYAGNFISIFSKYLSHSKVADNIFCEFHSVDEHFGKQWIGKKKKETQVKF